MKTHNQNHGFKCLLTAGISLATLALVTMQAIAFAPTASAAEILIFSNEVQQENSNTITLDYDDTGGDVIIKFGETLAETLTWDSAGARFDLSDDLNVDGNITLTGTVDGRDLAADGTKLDGIEAASSTSATYTLDSDNAGAGADVDIVANQGSDSDGTLRYNATANQWEISNDGGAFGAISTGGAEDFESVYTTDADNTITAASGLAIDTNTWDISAAGAMTGIGAITMDGLLTGTAGVTVSGAAVNLNNNSNFAVNVAAGTSTGAVSVGGGSNTVAINTTNWDVSSAGVASGFTGLTTTGVADFSGTTRMALDQAASNPGTCTEGDIHYNTTDNLTYTCTATNTWTALSIDADQDFEGVYSTDGDDTLTTSNAAFTVNTGTSDFIIDSNDWNVTAAGALDATSLTDGTAILTGGVLTIATIDGDDNTIQDINWTSMKTRTKQIAITMNDVTINADGSTNLANVYVNSESGVNTHQYYTVETTQSSQQDLDLKIKVKLPNDFVDFSNANDLTFDYKTTNTTTTDNKIDILVEDDDGDDAYTAADGQALNSATWTQYSDEFDGISFDPAAGEYIYITAKGYTRKQGATNYIPYIGEIVISYTGR